MTAVLQLSGVTGGINVAASSSRYWALDSAFLTNSVETSASILYRSGGTLSNLYCYIISNANTGNSTAKSRKDAANGNASITIGSGVTGSLTDAVNTDTIAAGSKYACQFTASASGGALMPATAGSTLAASSNTVTRISAGGGTDTSVNTTYYLLVIGNGGVANTTEVNVQFKNKNTATLQNLAVNISANTASVATATSRKNTAAGNMTISIGSGVTGTLEDTSNTDSLTSGDLINFAFQSTITTSVTWTYIAADYLSTGSNSLMISGASGGNGYSANQTNYCVPCGQNTATATETSAQNQAQAAFTASNLEGYVSANTVTATSTIRLRKNTANGNMNFTVASSTTGYFEDVTNTDSIAATDLFNYSIVTGATGTSLTSRFIGISASYSGGTTYNDTISETATATDSETGSANDNASFSESGTSSDTMVATASDVASLSETTTSSDSYIGGKATSDTLSESSSATDLVNGAQTVNGNMTEQIVPSDSFSGVASDTAILSETAAANDNYTDISPAPTPIVIVTQTGSGDDSWKKYLAWLARKKKAEFKKKATKAGIREVTAAKIADIAANEVLKQEIELKNPFYAFVDKNEQEARNAAQQAILSIYDEVWRQMAVQKREFADLRSELEEIEDEEALFLMMM